ncbi:transcription factor DUO1-like [Solanum lycopersicum]|nr:transcription factor DUO1-like [Solanum lycopersicum]
MQGRRSSCSYHRYDFDDDFDEIKKGSWKEEEDEVLINHVKKYGPRDWSSIRSKGLLQRTGKSCRLRWVNKLRPNLKNGVKFSGEEERTVIELQGQFGNKWARIATYLSGRTDNDVKNFWSSRQKRLARILRTSQNNTTRTCASPLILEAPKLSSSKEHEESLSKSQSCSSSYIDNSDHMMNQVHVPLEDLVMTPNSIAFEPNMLMHHQLHIRSATTNPNDEKKLGIIESSHIPTHDDDFALPLENQEFSIMPNFIDVLGHGFDNVEIPYVNRQIEKPLTPDSFIDDFPLDMFEHIEPLQSPSQW